MNPKQFDYDLAFKRNLGWLKPEEQQKLRDSSIAIAGVGGAGGFQAEALARLGIGRFKLADPDTFELVNFNRQAGATMATLGQSKTTVIQELILNINPQAKVEIFPEGLTSGNSDRFFENVDLVIDGIEFFAIDAKMLLFEKSRSKNIPAITSCPLGFGASLMVFLPGGMDCPTYFHLRKEMSEMDRRIALAFGLSPTPFCLKYINRDRGPMDLDRGEAASVCPGLMLVGALTATEAVKILTGKGKVYACPFVYQIDLLTQKAKRKYYFFGMRGPWMRIKKWFLKKFLLRKNPNPA